MNCFIAISLLSTLVISVTAQNTKFSCEPESNLPAPTFISSYYQRTTKYRCTFTNVNPSEDLKSLKSAASGLPSDESVASIVFSNSSLSELPDKTFFSYQNVRKLDASNLVLGNISPTAFSNTKFWDLIDLSKNSLKTLRSRTFAGLNIKILDLSMNYIATIEETAFVGADVEKILLSYNQIKSVKFLNSFNFFNLIEFNNNLFEAIDKIEVKKEGWANKRTIFGDPDYPKLFFQNNKIKKFDCSSTIRITSIDLDSNPDLTGFSLNQCTVEEIDVSNCPNLKTVSLNENLKTFVAKNVKLIDIDLSSAKSLTALSLTNSSLTPTLFDSITKVENLTLLDLSYNNIGPLNISSFAKLKNLQFLMLKATNISNIQFGTFSHQHNVKQLDISDNNLKFFDMNMIFSMNNLLVLDLSGNELTTLENVESAHYTFTLLQKIDLSNNNWQCSYLMKLIKIFRVYKVALIRSNIEELGTNIHGIGCEKVDGNDDIEPLAPDASNITDIREKMNEMINELAKFSQFKNGIEAKIRQLEISQASSGAVSEALRSEKSQKIEVANSTLLESVLVIVCVGFIAFIAIKSFILVKNNFLRPRKMRASSEHTLAMNVDDY